MYFWRAARCLTRAGSAEANHLTVLDLGERSLGTLDMPPCRPTVQIPSAYESTTTLLSFLLARRKPLLLVENILVISAFHSKKSLLVPLILCLRCQAYAPQLLLVACLAQNIGRRVRSSAWGIRRTPRFMRRACLRNLVHGVAGVLVYAFIIYSSFFRLGILSAVQQLRASLVSHEP